MKAGRPTHPGVRGVNVWANERGQGCAYRAAVNLDCYGINTFTGKSPAMNVVGRYFVKKVQDTRLTKSHDKPSKGRQSFGDLSLLQGWPAMWECHRINGNQGRCRAGRTILPGRAASQIQSSSGAIFNHYGAKYPKRSSTRCV